MSLKFWKGRAPKRPHRPGPLGPQQPTNQPTPPVVTPPPAAVVEPLHVDGLHLALPDGSPWFGLGITAFPLLKYWIEDRPKAEAFLDYCQANGLFPRVFGMYDGWLGRFVPSDYPDYHAHLTTLCEELNRRGLRMQFTACADWVAGRGSDALLAIDPVAFFDQCCETLRPFSHLVLADAGNELDHNGLTGVAFNRPVSLLASKGSRSMNTIPWPEPWDFAEQHGRRDAEFKTGLKDVKNYHEGSEGLPYAVRAPIIDTEPISIGETPNDDGKRCITNPADIYDTVACPFGSGYVLHVRAGMRDLSLPGPVADACVRAGVQAAKDLQPVWRDGGVYVRGDRGHGFGGFALVDSPESPNNGSAGEYFPDWWIRAYGRWHGDEQRIVIARHTAETNVNHEAINADLVNRLQALPAWTIVAMHGLTPERPSVVVVRHG